MNKKIKFISAIFLQLIIIFVIIAFKYSVFTGGTEVFLKILPIDPRSPLRGDYIVFQYDISNLERYNFSYEYLPRNGETVYIKLRQEGKYWVVNNNDVGNIAPQDNSLFIKARVVSGGFDKAAVDRDFWLSGSEKIKLEYGIEQYFIPENAGQNFTFWNKEVSAKVAIDENGNAVIKQIFVEGQSWP
ncbi:MAG: GDYXXLXY domain-containing protein [bacterium]